MKFNKFLIIGLLLVAIVSFGAVSASDSDILTVQATSSVNDDLVIEDIDENSQAVEEEVNDNILKEQSSPIIITNETFNNYFDNEGRLLDSVAEGSVLDFQGLFEASDNIKSVYINKSVNITSSTKDATFIFNSTNGELGKEYILGRFVVEGATTINIDNVIFNRTQLLIYDSSDVVLNNIKIISDRYDMYSGGYLPDNNGILRIYNDKRVSIKNSYFYAHTISSGVIELSDIEDFIIDNNTFYSFGTTYGNSVGKKINLKTIANTVKMTNNIAYANCSWAAFAFLQAKEILFENNTCTYYRTSTSPISGMWVQLGQDSQSDIIVRNNKNIIDLRVYGNSSLMNNEIYKLSTYNSYPILLYNNTVAKAEIKSSNVLIKNSNIDSIDIKKSNKNITIENNVINGEVSIQSSETTFNNNSIVGSVSIESGEVFFDNNYINGDIQIKDSCELIGNYIIGKITLSSKQAIISENTIKAPLSDYAIIIKSNGNCILNEISKNKIYSKLYCGDNAVSYDESYLNYIEDNSPKTQIYMFVNSTVTTFDYGESTEIIVNMPDVKGNVTIGVDGEEDAAKLVKGSASQVLTKYALGVNNVSVVYYDAVNDAWAIGHTNFTVNKVDYCPVELIYTNPSENKNSDVNFILPEDANGDILINLTNGSLTAWIKQEAKGGTNIITLPGLSKGNYIISATFTSVKYVTNSSIGNISFVHIPVYGLVANDVVMDYKDGSKYKVLVTEDDVAVVEEIVKITFNGKTIDVKTDKDGYATLTLDAAPKSYTIKAEFNGMNKSSKVTIKNILKASNVSKKKAKTIKFSASLKTSKGKAIMGKKITFKLKGKTYTAKTNKKGTATISIKNLKVGKYTITSKYGACTVKNTIKIKK